MRILMVDDDPLLVKALLRSIRLQRPDWRLTPVTSGEAAIASMGQDDFDLVLTDMQMPGLDGTDVLTSARELQPEAIRVILSGHAPQRRILESEGDYHRFLTKPVDPVRLVSIIESFSRRHPDPYRRKARAMVVKLDRIPSLQSHVDALRALLVEGRPSLRTAADIVAQDIGLALQTLKLVNSGYLPGERPITDITQAVEFLGLEQIHELVIERGQSGFTAGEAVLGSRLDRLWKHSLEIATTAWGLVLQETGDTPSAAEAYTAGLLHDVGIAVLAALPGMDYGEVEREMRASGQGVIAVERATCGTDHVELGAELLHLWGLPESFIQAVRDHHNPRLLDHRSLVSLALHVSHLGGACEASEADSFRDSGLEIPGLAEVTTLPLWGVILRAWRTRRVDAPLAPSTTVNGGSHDH